MEGKPKENHDLEEFQKDIMPFIEFSHLIEQASSSIDSCIDSILVFINENNLLGENKGQFYQILKILSNSIKCYPRSKNIIIFLLKHYNEDISQKFTSEELFSIFASNKLLLLALYESNCININTLQSKYSSSSYNFPFFYPEFKENYQILSTDQKERIQLIEKDIQEKFDSKIDTFLSLREDGHSELKIAQLIRNDDVDNFSVLVSPENFNLNMEIPISIFESDPLLQSKPSLIEYACFFGSIKIFKFLWLKNLDIDQRIYSYAIAGNNTEIIHILESKYPPEVSDDGGCIIPTILYQRPEIFEYFIENYNFLVLTQKMLAETIESHDFVMFNCIMSYISKENPNCPILITKNYRTSKVNCSIEQVLLMKDICDKNLLHTACIYGNLEIVNFLSKLKFDKFSTSNSTSNKNSQFLFDINEKDNYHLAPLHYACKYDYLDIIKTLLNSYGDLIDWNIEDNDYKYNYFANMAFFLKILLTLDTTSLCCAE